MIVSWEIDKNIIRWTILYMLIRLKWLMLLAGSVFALLILYLLDVLLMSGC